MNSLTVFQNHEVFSLTDQLYSLNFQSQSSAIFKDFENARFPFVVNQSLFVFSSQSQSLKAFRKCPVSNLRLYFQGF